MEMMFKDFKLRSVYVGHKDWPAMSDSKFHNYNYHRVYVVNQKSGAKTFFEFWASNANPRISNEQDLMGALYCYLSDAQAGEMDYEEFCSEFGYEWYDRKSKQVWKKCQQSAESFRRVFFNYDVCDLLNEIQEEYDV